WPLTSVSPSTTSSATASYLTALPPVEHGVLGFLMYFPEYNHVFNMLSFRSPDRLHEDLIVRGFLPEKYLTQPTVLAMLEDSGILVGAYNNTQYAGSGLSRLIYTDHLPYHYFALGDMLWLAQQQLELPARQFQFLYWSTPDTIAHTYGARSGAYVHEVFMLLSTVKQLLIPQLDDDTAMIICADHGHIDGNDDEAIDLTKISGLVDLFRVPPAGEGRAPQLFIRPGYVDEAKAQLLAAGNMLVLTRDEYIASKLLGDATPRQDILEKLGDLVVLPHGSRRTLYPYEMRPHTAMVGRHGGLSPEEMVIPLIVF
ncbi:MAG TPA: alkaline phosphatase family protein, partial [Armatimonadota bacterium]|nr:alkaline phosphatase family protein [Armatimonadota bacterium]